MEFTGKELEFTPKGQVMTIKEIFIEEMERADISFDNKHADYIDDNFTNVLEVVEKTAERWALRKSKLSPLTHEPIGAMPNAVDTTFKQDLS